MSSRREGTVCVVTGTGGSIGRPAGCRALVDLALDSFGRVVVLFHLAATACFNRLEDVSDEERNCAPRGDEVGLFRPDEGVVAHGG